MPQRSQHSWKHNPRHETDKYQPPKCQVLDAISQGNPKGSPKRCSWPQTRAGCPQRRRDHREVCGPPGTSSLSSSILEMRGTALQRAPGTFPTSLQLGGQLRGEPLQGPGKAKSAHLPVHPPKQTRCNQEHLSTVPSSSHPTTPLIPLLLQSPEPAGCPGFNPTGSIIPIISLHFQSTSLHFQSTDLGAVHKSLHPESKAIYCFISSHLHFSNPWKQGRGLEHMGCPGGVCPADGGLGLLS